MTGYTFSYWWIFQKYETLWKVGLYTGCVWGTHDPVVGVAFIVVTIMFGVWHYVSNYFGIVLVFFWYYVWQHMWHYFGIMSGIIYGIMCGTIEISKVHTSSQASLCQSVKPPPCKTWFKLCQNFLNMILMIDWLCPPSIWKVPKSLFSKKNTLKVPWKHLKHCQYPVPRKVVDGVLCQVPGKYLEST